MYFCTTTRNKKTHRNSKQLVHKDNIAQARFDAQVHPNRMKSLFYFRTKQSPNQLFQLRPDHIHYVRFYLPKIFAHRFTLLNLSVHLGLSDFNNELLHTKKIENDNNNVSEVNQCDVKTFWDTVAQLVLLNPRSPARYHSAVDAYPRHGPAFTRATVWKILLMYLPLNRTSMPIFKGL